MAALQAATAFGTLALEDEAHEPAVVALADLVEADRAPALAVGAHDGAGACDRRAALGGREAELDLLADLQRARTGEQHPAAAEIDREGLDRATAAGSGDRHRAGGGDAYVLAFLDHLHRVQILEAQQLAVLERDGALQADAPAAVGELQHQPLQASALEGVLGAEHERHQQRMTVALGHACLHAFARRSDERHHVGAPRQLQLGVGVALGASQFHRTNR
jgi:hypothetical protein